MTLCPAARKLEFEYPLQLANPQDQEVLVDFPSGGSYLKPYLMDLAPLARYHAVEQVPQYGEMVQDITAGTWDQLNFENRSVDIVLCLAALHHLYPRREPFYRECRRILGPGGRLVIGDVAQGTNADRFLSEFVNGHSPEGHTARFFQQELDASEIESAGFSLSHWEIRDFSWVYPDRQTAIAFCRGLFRLGSTADEVIWEALGSYLGIESTAAGVEMGWQLAFIRADLVD